MKQEEFDFSEKKPMEALPESLPEIPEPVIEWEMFFIVERDYKSYWVGDKQVVTMHTLEIGRWVVDDKAKRVTMLRWKKKTDGSFLGQEGLREGDVDKALHEWMVRRYEFKERIMYGKEAR